MNSMKKSSSLSQNETPPVYGSALDLDFELPDWSGHLASRRVGSKDAWIAYCRSNLAKLRKLPGHADKLCALCIAAEFHF